MKMKQTQVIALPLVLFALACSGGDDTDSALSDLNNGSPANEPELRAVVRIINGTSWNYYCTGTLIAPQLVLTAKHCTALSGEPDLGVDVNNHLYQVDREITAGRIGAGATGLGRDAAIYHLRTPVPASEATPIPVRARPLDASDEGKKMLTVGWGTGRERTKGQSTLDSVAGKPFARAFGSESAFRDFITRTRGARYLSSIGYGETLDPDAYDVHTGLQRGGPAAGDAQTCHGDSGGPLLDRSSGHYEVVAVTSTGSEDCFLGGYSAGIGPDVLEVIRQARTSSPAWVACDNLGTRLCAGDSQVTCSPGRPRLVEVESCGGLGSDVACVASTGSCQHAPSSASAPRLTGAAADARQFFGGGADYVLRNSGRLTGYGNGTSTNLGDNVVQVQVDGTSGGALLLRRDGTVGGSGALAGIPSLRDVVEISNRCARIRDGSVLCWKGSPQAPTLPTVVPGISDAVQVTDFDLGAGGCARRANGQVACWGANGNGLFGYRYGDPRVPYVSEAAVTVPDLNDATDVSVSMGLACAARSNGHVLCWGSSSNVGMSSWRAEVSDIEDAESVRVTRSYACALRRGGRVSCWGYLPYHSRNAMPSGTHPVEIVEASPASAMFLSDHSACILTEGGHAAECWGVWAAGALGESQGWLARPRRFDLPSP